MKNKIRKNRSGGVKVRLKNDIKPTKNPMIIHKINGKT